MSTIQPGVCRYCRCTEDRACRIPPYGSDDTCAWMPDTMRTVCSNPQCIRAWERERKKAKAAEIAAAQRARRKYGDRYIGWGYGQIIADLRKRDRKAKKRRAA